MIAHAPCPAEIDSYKADGYWLKEGVFTSQECDQLLRIFESHAAPDFSAIMNLDRSVPVVRELMKDPRCLAVLETLKSARMVALMSQILFKRVGTPYASQAWNPHQDNGYVRAPEGTIMTLLLTLADAGPENGGLYVFPGSHKEGLLPFEPTVSYHEVPGSNPGNTVRLPEGYERVDIHAKKGALLAFEGELVHGSHSNRSPRSRPSISILYMIEGNHFVSGNNAQRAVIRLRPS